MTRILYWNIENFSINKIENLSMAVEPGFGGLTENAASDNRRLIILTTLLNTDPDIFVLVEVSSAPTGVSRSLISATGGALACRYLLRQMQINCAADWCLVPPQVVGTAGASEGVAVFYRSGRTAATPLFFTGPDLWLGAIAGPAGVSVPYADPWDEAFHPAGAASRVVPAAAGVGGDLREDRLAGRVLPLPAPGALRVPGDWVRFRQPYYCSFYEGATNRNISIFAMHCPPDPGYAQDVMFAAAPIIAGQPALANETRVVVADFNVNLIDPDDGDDLMTYHDFRALNYQPLLTMPAAFPGAPASLPAYIGYATTHIRRNPVFLSSAAAPQFYPAFGYRGAEIGDGFSIDNILVHPHVAAHDYHFTVVNPIVGNPYAVVPGLAGTVPGAAGVAGATPIATPSFFNNPPANYPWAPVGGATGQSPPHDIGLRNTLLGWNNYGRLRSTSDHLPLFAEV